MIGRRLLVAIALAVGCALAATAVPGRGSVAVETGKPPRHSAWPVPVPAWFWEWARWYLHHAEFRDGQFRARETRPAAAPERIPAWAWRRVEALAASSRRVDPWADLRRPLRLVQLPPGAECPRTPGGRPAPEVAIALGDGPAYPVLGLPEPPPHPAGVADLSGDLFVAGWYAHKTLWAIDEAYAGRLLIRGARIDRPGPVEFTTGRELPVHAAVQPGWRYLPTATHVRGPGCYALQVDGTTFTSVIVFEARLGTATGP